MFDWKSNYKNMEDASNNVGRKITKCGWYIYDDEYALVARRYCKGIIRYSGIPLSDETVIFYYFSGKFSDSPFGVRIPTVVDDRT